MQRRKVSLKHVPSIIICLKLTIRPFSVIQNNFHTPNSTIRLSPQVFWKQYIKPIQISGNWSIEWTKQNLLWVAKSSLFYVLSNNSFVVLLFVLVKKLSDLCTISISQETRTVSLLVPSHWPIDNYNSEIDNPNFKLKARGLEELSSPDY